MVSGLDKEVNFKDFSRRPFKFKTFSRLLRPSPFFRLASNAFPDVRSVGRIEKKKPKKITRSLGI